MYSLFAYVTIMTLEDLNIAMAVDARNGLVYVWLFDKYKYLLIKY